MKDLDTRHAIIDACRWMNASGLNQGTSGNISVRTGEHMLITPSGVPYDTMTPDLIASVALDGTAAADGPVRPSSEWRFHHDILMARGDAGAVVHTHSTHATALAMTRRPIPAAHYMVAAFGGGDVRCADYALFGTQALSDNVLRALDGRCACLLANHGVIVFGPTLAKALWLAEELETLARQYVISLTIGGPEILSEAEIAEALDAFKDYGQRG